MRVIHESEEKSVSLHGHPHNPSNKPAEGAHVPKGHERGASKSLKLIVLGSVGGLIVAALTYLIFFSLPKKPDVKQFGRTRAIQLDVLNGTGEPKLALRITEYLRGQGFDVVEMGNFTSSNVPSTSVLDRSGNLDAAKAVAASLGLAEDRVRRQIDKNLFLDATVIVGKDYLRLKAFQ